MLEVVGEILIASLEIENLDYWSAARDSDILVSSPNLPLEEPIATITDFLPLETASNYRQIPDGGLSSQPYQSIQREPSFHSGIRRKVADLALGLEGNH